MNKKILFLPIFVLLLALSVQFTMADVLIEESASSAAEADAPVIDMADIATGEGQAGNYVLFSCATANDLGNTFNDPTPGTWEELDEGACGDDGRLCRHGIWGGFVADPNDEDITCSWTELASVFAAGSIRYSGVDPDNPIIDIECNAGLGTELTAPSIITEAGSQVIRVYTSSALTQSSTVINSAITTNAIPEDTWEESAFSPFQNVSSEGRSALTTETGPTGTSLINVEIQSEWRACTIAIRMAPPTDVPTMSEWGLIAFAAFAGIAGFWFMRRRQLAA